jgi:hypothetical protein
MGPRAGDQRERNGMHLAPVAGVSGKLRAPVQVARALVEGGADPDARDSMARGPSPASPSPCSRGVSGADLHWSMRLEWGTGADGAAPLHAAGLLSVRCAPTQRRGGSRTPHRPHPRRAMDSGSLATPPPRLCPPLLACRVPARGAGSQRGAPRQDARDHQGLSPSDLTNLEGSGGY